MKTTIASFVRRVFKDEQGQTAVLVVLGLGLVMMGVGGFTVDLAHFYLVRTQLQNSTNAAGLAAGGFVWDNQSIQNAAALARNYALNDNVANNLTENPSYPIVQTPCLNMLMTTGTGCTNDSNGNANPASSANAIRITEQVSMPTWFMNLFGVHSLITQATATASMQGATQPWNVAIILDATPSMSTNDSNCNNVTQFTCAEQGIQTMLSSINPCSGSTNCASTANSVLRVSLFSFPNVTTSSVGIDYCAANGTPEATAYTLPLPGATSYTPLTYKTASGATWTSTYQITPPNTGNGDANGFFSDFYNNGALNTSSILVKAVGHGGNGGCLQVPDTSGPSSGKYNNLDGTIGRTYFAGAIYAAQAALTAEGAAFPGAQNAIIYLSDGQATIKTTSPNDFPANLGSASGTNYTSSPYPTTQQAESGAMNDTSTSSTYGTYPSSVDQCQQAILAGQYATSQGTRVYGVAYGSEDSGCYTTATYGSGMTANATELTWILTSANLLEALNDTSLTTVSQVSPCETVENMASSLQYFYSDYLQGSSGVASNCVSASHSITSLNQIFQSIAESFTKPRLLPNKFPE